MMKVIEYTNKGNREENQDYSSWCLLDDKYAFFVLADGMGGYEHGDIAAKVVVESMLEFASHNFSEMPPATLLNESFAYGNDNLMLERIALGAGKMGCVVAALLISGEDAYIGWLGDSRVYMFRNNQEVFRTTDHSIVNELALIKTLRAEDYERFAAIVTKSIMGDDKLDEVPICKIHILTGDKFVLCSDGFHKEIPIVDALDFNQELRECLEAKASSIHDNFTFQLVVV